MEYRTRSQGETQKARLRGPTPWKPLRDERAGDRVRGGKWQKRPRGHAAWQLRSLPRVPWIPGALRAVRGADLGAGGAA